MFNQVKEYVSKMRELGYSEDKIKSELSLAGWSDNVIHSSLNNTPAKSENTTTISSDIHSSLFIGFLYVLKFISLWIAAISFILGLFILIDKAFSSVSSVYSYNSADYSNSLLNGYIASLIVTVPIFLFLFMYMRKDIKLHPEYRSFKLRKILILLTLIIAFCTIVIDLISVITGFLNGDVSWGFILKVLTIIFVLVPIFTYYYHDIAKDRNIIN